MITQEFYIQEYDWSIKVYYAVDGYYKQEILSDLLELNCSKLDFNQAKELLENYRFNEGFTCSDVDKRKTLMVLGLTTSPNEFYNTLEHEKGHAVTHIGISCGVNPYGEEIQYLNGEISKKMFPVAKKFLCKHCRQELDLFSQKKC